MPLIVNRQRIVGDVAGSIARLESLVSDLEHLGDGLMPTAEVLAAAPLLDPWCLSTCTLPCLIGGNTGHPTLKGRGVQTTEVWALAPELGWARTLSRFYRLGEPARLERQP